MQTPDMALFFLKGTSGHALKDAPGGDAYLTKDKAKLDRGRIVFCQTLRRCHSSKIPTFGSLWSTRRLFQARITMDCWNKYWAWTKTDDFKSKMTALVQATRFSWTIITFPPDQRVPVTLLQDECLQPRWRRTPSVVIRDNFSSQTYKDLPSVGSVTSSTTPSW